MHLMRTGLQTRTPLVADRLAACGCEVRVSILWRAEGRKLTLISNLRLVAWSSLYGHSSAIALEPRAAHSHDWSGVKMINHHGQQERSNHGQEYNDGITAECAPRTSHPRAKL